MKHLVFTVTNDLNYDQRMIRICTSLSEKGYLVTLIGRRSSKSSELLQRRFQQRRLSCFFQQGKSFYIEYNIRLLIHLFFMRFDLICAIDLDTIIPCYFISKISNKKRVYDAHELFCEMKEVVSRPRIFKVWKLIERWFVPKYPFGYTVNNPIRSILKQDYSVHYEVIRNIPVLKKNNVEANPERFIIYQGAVNHGRSFETLIPAFQWIDCPLWIYGDGNFLEECKDLVNKYNLHKKVIFKGKAFPDVLHMITPKSIMGLTLFENNGLSNYYSLANRFFDYIHAGIPQLCVDYPVYKEINEEFNVALLISDLSSKSIAVNINRLLYDSSLQDKMRANCIKAREVLNWQEEEKKLISFYEKVFAC